MYVVNIVLSGETEYRQRNIDISFDGTSSYSGMSWNAPTGTTSTPGIRWSMLNKRRGGTGTSTYLQTLELRHILVF